MGKSPYPKLIEIKKDNPLCFFSRFNPFWIFNFIYVILHRKKKRERENPRRYLNTKKKSVRLFFMHIIIQRIVFFSLKLKILEI